MSEMSILSNQYERLVSTTNSVNDSVILLKKKKFSKDDPNVKRTFSNISNEVSELNGAQNLLVKFLNSLLELINNDNVTSSEYVPNIVFEDYKNRILTIPYVKQDIEKIIELIQKKDNLSPESLDLLDNISSVLDSERTTLFRKLRTARG
jgi:hypothetical protein